MSGPIVIYGPPASGKTRNRDMLAKHFGKSLIVDGWDGRSRLADDALALCIALPSDLPRRYRAVSIADALRQVSLQGGAA